MTAVSSNDRTNLRGSCEAPSLPLESNRHELAFGQRSKNKQGSRDVLLRIFGEGRKNVNKSHCYVEFLDQQKILKTDSFIIQEVDLEVLVSSLSYYNYYYYD